jgi:hypothetical protein
MRKMGFFAIAATLALVAVGAWATSTASTSQARVDVLPVVQIDTMQMTTNAKDMPETEFVDYTFVYN